MSDIAGRLRAFQAEAPHWLALLAQVPAEHVPRHDTAHPAFHGCIDWHSACHAVWALLAARGESRDPRYDGIIDSVLMPAKLAAEAADLAARPQFEMPYGRAWFLRLALEDRLVTGSTRLTYIARDVAASLVAQYRGRAIDPFAREYANPCWALINMLDYAQVESRPDVGDAAREAARGMASYLDRLPPESDEDSWPDFMAVTPMFCELLIRSGAVPVEVVLAKAGSAAAGADAGHGAAQGAPLCAQFQPRLGPSGAGAGQRRRTLSRPGARSYRGQPAPSQLVARRLPGRFPLGPPVRNLCTPARDAADFHKITNFSSGELKCAWEYWASSQACV